MRQSHASLFGFNSHFHDNIIKWRDMICIVIERMHILLYRIRISIIDIILSIYLRCY